MVRDPSLTTEPSEPQPEPEGAPPAPAELRDAHGAPVGWLPDGWRPERPDAPEVRFPSSALPVIDAAMSAPAPPTAPATRDLTTAQLAMLDRCPGCGRPVGGHERARRRPGPALAPRLPGGPVMGRRR